MAQYETLEGTCERDGKKFRYVVQYTPRHWDAKVFGADGSLLGTPGCGVHGDLHEGETLREDVKLWIEGAIRHRVGVP